MRFPGWSCALMLAGSLSANALSVSPTRIVVEDDRGAQMSVRLTGENELTPVEVTIIERLAGGAFAAVPETVIRVQPPQLLLIAGQPRNIQIEVSGDIAFQNSRSFYLRIEELGLRSAQGSVQTDREIVLLATYLLPVHVLGGHVGTLTADIVPGAQGAQIELSNTGLGPALLSACRIAFIPQTGPDIEIDGRRIAEETGSDAILPDETVHIDIAALLSGKDTRPETAIIGLRAGCDPS